MIIVEGPDGAGKTTLVNRLVDRFGLPLSPKLVASDAETVTMSKKEWVEQNVARGFQVMLFDRHCLISEPIYNSVIKTKIEPPFDDVWWTGSMHKMFYAYCRPLIIYCIPPYKTVYKNVHTDGDHQPSRVVRGIRPIYGQYVSKAASDGALAGALVYDYTTTPPDHMYRSIELAIERMTHRV